MISKLAEFILGNLTHPDLKNLFYEHMMQDNHHIYKKVKIDDKLNDSYDIFIYYTILARSYALNNKYKESFKNYDLALQQLRKNSFDQHSVSFFKINKAISLGYLGKYYGDGSKNTITDILNDLESNSKFIDDAIMYSINLSDIALYNRLRGLVYHIKNIEQLLNKYPDKINNDKFIYLRLGILCLFQYISTKDIRYCKKSKEYFDKEIKNSKKTDYRNYWAKCGYIICQNQLSENFSQDFLKKPPKEFRSRALPWPSILYVLIKANEITGNVEWVNRILRTIERKIQQQIHDLPKNHEYQNLVINKYKMILDEWINIIFNQYNSHSINNEEACRRLIKVSEISKYRILSEKIQPSNQTYRNNLSNMLDHIKNKELGNHILYLSEKINSISEKKFFFILQIDLKKNTFNILKYGADTINKICNEWEHMIINEYDNVKIKIFIKEVIKTLNLSEALNIDKELIIIPNKILSNIPFSLISNFKANLSYWPNLSLTSRVKISKHLKKEVDIYYDQNEDNAVKEMNVIKKECDKNFKINTQKIKMINSNSAIIHCVCHFNGNDIIIDGKNINYKNVFEKISSKNKIVILNMCKGSSNLIKNNIYDSIPLFLILKGVQTIICHRWDLGQKASLSFSKLYYKNLNNCNNINYIFNDALQSMQNHKFIEYGGYTLWGNNKIGIENGY